MAEQIRREDILDNLVKKFWLMACYYDGVDPKSPFIAFSENNPYVNMMDKYNSELLEIRKARINAA